MLLDLPSFQGRSKSSTCQAASCWKGGRASSSFCGPERKDEETYEAVSTVNIGAEIFTKGWQADFMIILRSYITAKLGSSQGHQVPDIRLNKSVVNKCKDKSQDHLKGSQKNYLNIPHTFMIKVLSKLGRDRAFLIVIKGVI